MTFYVSENEAHKKKERLKAREIRATTWWKQKLAQGCCYYCEKLFQPADLTMDHKIPISRGGRSNKGNLVVSCKACNTKKRHKTPAETALENLSKLNENSDAIG